MHRWLASLLLTALSANHAVAGTGPWILGQGDEQIYIGAETQRLDRLAIGSGSYADDVIVVDGGITTLGLKALVTLGLTSRFEIEGELPYNIVFSNRSGAVCDALGLGACRTTKGIGIIALRGKALLLDEVAGKPLSLSVGLDLRFGQTTFENRQRITNLGEGTFDIEPRLLMGRVGPLPNGYWSLYWGASFRYRVPIDRDFMDDGIDVPGYELTSDLEALFTPGRLVSIGPAVNWWLRPNGVDFEDVDLTDPDRLLGLRATVFEAGAKVIVRSGRNITFVGSFFRTVYARNNPEVYKVGVGVSFRDFVPDRKGG